MIRSDKSPRFALQIWPIDGDVLQWFIHNHPYCNIIRKYKSASCQQVDFGMIGHRL